MVRAARRHARRTGVVVSSLAAAATGLVLAVPGTAQGSVAQSDVYLAEPSSSTAASGLLEATQPSPAGSHTTTTGRQTGWYELRAGTSSLSAGPFSSAPAPSGAGYLWSDASLDGATVPAGTWTPTITLQATGSVTLKPVVRFYLRGADGVTYTLLAKSAGTSVTLGSTPVTIALPGVSVGSVTVAPGQRLYVDLVAKVTSTCCRGAAVVSYDGAGSAESLVIPGIQLASATVVSSSASPSPTSSPSPTASPAAASSPSPTSTTSSPSPTTSSVKPVWHPAPGTSWQWQITGTVDTSLPVQMYDIDLFDAQPAASTYTVPGFGTVDVPKGTNAGVIDTLHAQGKVVICYLDSGAWEKYRPDAALFPASVIGNSTGWSGERWLDIRSSAWASFEPLIEARMDLAVRSGCDGVEPDQNNPLGNNPGFPITAADQKAWYLEVARIAHVRGLSVGQKNGIETTDADTVAAFDWDLNEECNMYSECSVLQKYVAAGKAVFQVEYADEGMTTSSFCPQDNAANFDGLLKYLDLGVFRVACR